MHEIRKKCNKRWKKSTELQINNHLFGMFVKVANNASVTNNALFVKALQTLQTLHIFGSQARVRI